MADSSHTSGPAETESEQTYSEVYKAAHAKQPQQHSSKLLAMMNSHPYKEMKELPIDKLLGDNCTGFQNFCQKVTAYHYSNRGNCQPR